MGTLTDRDLDSNPEYQQAVKVYEHGNGPAPTIVAVGMVTIRNGKPDKVRVTADDELTVYVPDGDWDGAGRIWACPARVDVAT
jgi:hypothetical protein